MARVYAVIELVPYRGEWSQQSVRYVDLSAKNLSPCYDHYIKPGAEAGKMVFEINSVVQKPCDGEEDQESCLCVGCFVQRLLDPQNSLDTPSMDPKPAIKGVINVLAFYREDADLCRCVTVQTAAPPDITFWGTFKSIFWLGGKH